MAGARFCRYACMGNTESSSFESFGPNKGSEVTSSGRIVRVLVLLETFVGTETIACIVAVSMGMYESYGTRVGKSVGSRRREIRVRR